MDHSSASFVCPLVVHCFVAPQTFRQEQDSLVIYTFVYLVLLGTLFSGVSGEMSLLSLEALLFSFNYFALVLL